MSNAPQVNLLPDVKQAFLRAKQQKRFVTFIATWVTAGALGVLILLLLVVQGWQRVRLNGLNEDIKTNSDKIQKIREIDKILTIQNQLTALPLLHEQKPVASRLFTMLSQVVPAEATIARLSINFETNSIEMRGEASKPETVNKLEVVNKFIDTLKFTDYQVAGSEDKRRAFTQVLLSSFSRDDKAAGFTVMFNFEPALFDAKSEAVLVVPKIITTRSETERPTGLFKNSTLPEQPAEGEQ